MLPATGLRLVIAIVAAAAILRGNLAAQGLSGATLEVLVTTGSGSGVSGATVTITEASTGVRRQITSGSSGRALFGDLPVGSYNIEARSIGHLPTSLSNLVIRLSDRARVRVVMRDASAQDIGTVSVTSSILRDPGAGGPRR